MSDLRDYFKKQKDITDEFSGYERQKDLLEAQETQELAKSKKEAKRKKKLIEGGAKALSALGKLAAARSGGLVAKGAMEAPDFDLDFDKAEDIKEKYAAKRAELAEKMGTAREKMTSLRQERAISKEEERLKEKEERRLEKEQAEIERDARELEKVQEKAEKKAERKRERDASEAYKLRKIAQKDVDKTVEQLIEDIEKEQIQGEGVVEVLKGKGVDPEKLKDFEVGLFEDEDKQISQLEALKKEIRADFIKQRVASELELGKEYSPEVLDALGLTKPEAKPQPQVSTEKSVTIQVKDKKSGEVRTEVISEEKYKELLENPEFKKEMEILKFKIN
jgi:hypothetical protein